MKLKTFLAGTILTGLIGAVAVAQKLERPYTAQSIAGIWKGKLQETDAVPAIEVDLRPDGSSVAEVAGKVIFYVKQDAGSGNERTAKSETKLLEPKLDGQWLSFKVIRGDGSPARFRMQFTKDDEALLSSGDEPSPTGAAPIRLIRSR